MDLFSYIIWDVNPDMFTIPLSALGMGDRPVRWYGVLFALGFILSQQVMIHIYKTEKEDLKDIETLTTFMVLGTILGARLGHCLFYNPAYYLTNPIEILKVWEGGLASHGGGIGLLTAIWLYVNYDIKVKWALIIPIKFSSKKRVIKRQSFLWVTDRLIIVVALTGSLIRTGNLMNSEMEGLETNSKIGLVYSRATYDLLNYDEEKIEEVRIIPIDSAYDKNSIRVPLRAEIVFNKGLEITSGDEQFFRTRLANALKTYTEVIQHIDFGDHRSPLEYEIKKERGREILSVYGEGIIRHPAQLYEATFCVLLMILFFLIWKYRRDELPPGFSFGLFMALLFIQRFFNEFFKMNQEDFEADIPLNMGQWLSIPMVVLGIGMMIWSFRQQKLKTDS